MHTFISSFVIAFLFIINAFIVDAHDSVSLRQSRCWISEPLPDYPIVPIDPCMPSPCGMYGECRNIGGMASCSCLATYRGSPPNCRPECRVNSECAMNLACNNEKCRDPCLGSCAITSLCTVHNHVPVCTCPEGYTGDPFSNCYPRPITSKERVLSREETLIFLQKREMRR